ncbi:hypothetical protein BY458DRAFT_487975 [Sporodiniella umbellata]|nr:hypothetical protein BY458DRAFT_487975 [Sporodiniella umbellata]
MSKANTRLFTCGNNFILNMKYYLRKDFNIKKMKKEELKGILKTHSVKHAKHANRQRLLSLFCRQVRASAEQSPEPEDLFDSDGFRIPVGLPLRLRTSNPFGLLPRAMPTQGEESTAFSPPALRRQNCEQPFFQGQFDDSDSDDSVEMEDVEYC